jgi:hypothetical protein
VHRLQAERIKNKVSQSAVDITIYGFFDYLANEEIADIRIVPAFAWLKIEAVGSCAIKQLRDIPWLLAAPNGVMVGGKITIVRDASAMLEQLTERERSADDRFIEPETSLRNKL